MKIGQNLKLFSGFFQKKPPSKHFHNSRMIWHMASFWWHKFLYLSQPSWFSNMLSIQFKSELIHDCTVPFGKRRYIIMGHLVSKTEYKTNLFLQNTRKMDLQPLIKVIKNLFSNIFIPLKSWETNFSNSSNMIQYFCKYHFLTALNQEFPYNLIEWFSPYFACLMWRNFHTFDSPKFSMLRKIKQSSQKIL